MSLSITDLFDESFYLLNNPDVAEAVRQGFFSSGLDHFIQFGQFEVANSPSRNPSPLFDEAFYLTNNPDVAEAVRQGFFPNGFQHFIQFGQFELANSSTRSPSVLFDEAYYLANNPDVLSAVKAKAFSSGYEHFIRFGQFEADTTQTRNPSVFYNERFYLEHNADVAGAVANGAFESGFRHFVLFGRKEGRTAINTPPVIGSDSFTVNEDTLTLVPNLLVNDGDRDGDPLVIAGFSNPTNGTLTNNNDGTLSYTPNLNFEGTDSFTYSVADGYGGIASATVSIIINASPDTPVANSDAFTINEDNQLVFTSNDLLGNDLDPEGDPFFFDTFAQPANGTVEGLGNGTFIYNPKSNFNGTDSFTYTITDGNGTTVAGTVNIAVRSVNDAPTAGNDTFTTNEDSQVSFSRAALLSNDTDADGNPILITGFTQPLNGRVVDLGGSYTYTPTANFNGTDSFTYTLTDGRGGNTSAVVTLTVNALNDAPIAGTDTFTTSEDAAVTFNRSDLLANDTDADKDALLITAFTPPSRGRLDSSNGAFTYTPEPNFSGSDSFTYTVTDGKGSSTTASVNLIVNAVQDLPVANDDAFTTNEDTELTFGPSNLLGNDSDADQEQLLINGFGPATNGIVRDNGNQTFTYTPDANFSGSDSFTYTVTDGSGGTAIATVNLTVASVNDVPVANSDAITTSEDTAVLISNVLANDTDVDQDAIAIVNFTQPSNGTVASVNGSFNYTPNANFNGSDSFTYTISDGKGGSATGAVNITVSAVNDAPVANSDTASTSEDTAVTIVNVLANDSDIEGNTFFLTNATSVANGQLVNQGNGTFLYTPNTNFNGTDSFAYTITDSNGGTASAIVSITVAAVNDAPVANSDTASTSEDTPVTINVLANDTDAEAEALTITGFSNPTKGSLSQINGSFLYTPNANANGTDNFSYVISDASGATATATVNVTISAVNDAPVANSDTASTSEDTAVTINVLANDTDVEGNTLVVTGVSTNPTRGTVVNNNGTFLYTPNTNFNGSDSFSYTISDGNGGTASATVNVTVAAINDAPVANSDTASTSEDTAVTINVLANDTDAEAEALTITGFSNPTKGSLSQTNGSFLYTPNANANGTDNFSYVISDASGATATATVNVTISAVNDAPVANSDTASTSEDTPVTINVLANDTDVEGNTLVVTGVSTNPTRGTVVNNNGTFLYTPNTNFNGSDSFAYTITDSNGGTASAIVSITVAAVNDAPVANSDTASTSEDTPVTINVLANDTDAEAEALTITGFSNPTKGSLSQINGSFLYTPNANANGTDNFSYVISDASGATATATVNVTISAVNDAPVANSDTASTSEDTAVTINVLANDTDVEGNTLVVTGVSTNPTRGTVVNNNGTFLYTPNTNFNGSDSFSYTISDGNGGTASATVNVTVAAINDAPVANSDTASTSEDTAVTINVLANDTDAEAEALTITGFSNPTKGSLSQTNGSFLYTPNANANGTDNFSYVISDASGATATATVNVTISAVNDAPVANSDIVTTNEDTTITIPVLANDADVEGNALVVTGVSANPTQGTVINNNGSFRYTPNTNFNSTDSFSYTISDGNGGTASATVSITVAAVNDSPKALADLLVVSAPTSTSINPATLLGNDTDVDSSLTIANVTQPSRGSLTANPDGTYTYNPIPSFNGNDSFNYTISDGNGGTASATVNLIVAQALDAGFSTSNNPDITSSTTIPHASVEAVGDNNFDYYSFTASSGSQGFFDIDFGDRGGTAALDTEIFLFSSNGTLLATNDDGAAPDPGSASTNDSFLAYNFTSSGRYVIGVAKFDSTNTIGVGITGTPLTPNDSYTLHVSIQNPTI